MWKLTNPSEEIFRPYWAWAEFFTPEECCNIIELGKKLKPEEAVVGLGEERKENHEIRRTKVSWLSPDEENEWIYRRCTDNILSMNYQFFKFDLDHIENMQFGIYESCNNSFYGKHRDDFTKVIGNSVRKLSFSIQLNEESSYDGGELLLYHTDRPEKIKREVGIGTIFPSYTLHEVTPVISGTRYTLVGWCKGSPFR